MSESTPEASSNERSFPKETEVNSKTFSKSEGKSKIHFALLFICISLLVYGVAVTRLFVVHLASCVNGHQTIPQTTTIKLPLILISVTLIICEFCYWEARWAYRCFEEGRKQAHILGWPIKNSPQNFRRVSIFRWLLKPVILTLAVLTLVFAVRHHEIEDVTMVFGAFVLVRTKGEKLRYAEFPERVDRLKFFREEIFRSLKADLNDSREEMLTQTEIRMKVMMSKSTMKINTELKAITEEISKQFKIEVQAVQERLEKSNHQNVISEPPKDPQHVTADSDFQGANITNPSSPVQPIPQRPVPLFISVPSGSAAKSRPTSANKKAAAFGRASSSRGRPHSQTHPGSSGSLAVPGKKSPWK